MEHDASDIKGESVCSPDELRSFTSWKLDVLDALSMDKRISHGEFRTAFRLLQHMNSETGAIFPSQERLADQIGVRPRQMREYIKGLNDKGWLIKSRKNYRATNSYAFDLKHVNAVLDRQIMLEDERLDRRKSAAHRDLTGGKLPIVTGGKLPIVTGGKAPPNTLMEHHTGTPEYGLGIEREGSTKRPYVAPSFDHLKTNSGESFK